MRATLCCLAWLLCSGSVAAQDVRALLLPKQTFDDRSVEATGLDAAASDALRRAGMRVVDLDSALRAQRMALSDEVTAGRVPNELTVLNADVLVSVQLRCSQARAAVLGSKLQAVQCMLDSKVVSSSSGDVLHAESQSLMGHGLNAAMAVQSLLEKRVPELLQGGTRTWLAAWSGADQWNVDLGVTHIIDRETAQGLAQRLRQLQGITAARLVAYDHGLAKYALSGRGRERLSSLADAIDADELLSLSVTYQTAHQLQADFDLVKAYSQRVVAMSIIPRSSELYGTAPELMRSALMSLPYLDMAHTMPLLASPEQARDMEARLRDKAKSLHVPLLLAVQLVPGASGWVATLKLVDTQLGRTLTAASAAETSSTQALGAAVRSFDERFRAAIQTSSVRQRFGFDDLAHRLSGSTRLAIQSFQLPERGDHSAPQSALLTVRNASQTVVRAARLRVSSVDRELEAEVLPDIAPGATAEAKLLLDPAALGTDECALLTASVSYAAPRGSEQVETVVPWCAGSARAAAPSGYAESLAVARRKHEAGEWQDALALYRRTNELFPNAQTLRGLGMVELDLGQRDAAVRDLGAALSSSVEPLTEQQRAQVRHLLSRSRLALAHR
jgi:tetratricopeptide (TPR) repeat protein